MPKLINSASASRLLAEVKEIINSPTPNCPNCCWAKVIDWWCINGQGYYVYQANCCQRQYIKKQGFRPQP